MDGLWATKSENAELLLSVQLVSKISNLCDPDPQTLQTVRQTDGRTDDMQSQYSALHYIVHRAVIIKLNFCLQYN